MTSKKSGTSCPNWGEGGGEVIWAMPERKHFFYVRASLIDIHFLNFKSLNLLADCSNGLLLEMSSPHFFLQGLAPGTNTLICGCGRQNRVGAGAWCGLCSAHSPPACTLRARQCNKATLPRCPGLISGSPRGAPARPSRYTDTARQPSAQDHPHHSHTHSSDELADCDISLLLGAEI